MSLKISDANWSELWQQEETLAIETPGLVEQVWKSSSQFGRCCEQHIPLRNGLHLVIDDCEIWHDLTVDSEPDDEHYPEDICISFVVSGTVRTIHRGTTEYILESPGKNYIEFAPGREIEDWTAGNRILKVRVGIQTESLLQMSGQSVSALPKELQLLVEAQELPPSYRMETTTLEMQQVLQQILNCPYQDWTRRFYLESKALELLILWLAHAAKTDKAVNFSTLSAADIHSIHQAKDILIRQLHQPPSLLELARQVGINDRKLKQGFRQVFGTTVFGYLHDYRMQQAHQLLVAGQTNIKETARLVGYASQSSFNAAFKRRFGMNPKAIR